MSAAQAGDREVQQMSPFLAAIPPGEVAEFCRRWRIAELAVFGSALREDFGPQSDVDILVDFGDGADWGLLDHVRMKGELETLLHRTVDLLTKRAVQRSENWLRRDEILASAQVVFSEREAIHAAG
jgi:predicted nucleotidyltransferase